jgi:hypothetical protein
MIRWRLGLTGGLLAVALTTAGCGNIPVGEAVLTQLPPPPAATEAPMDTPPTSPGDNLPEATKPAASDPLVTAPPPVETVPAPVESNLPVLSDDLKRGCQRGGDGTRGLAVGALAVDFTLDDTTGQSHTLSAMLAEKPVVIVFGSFT